VALTDSPRRRRRSAAEIEAVSRVADALIGLEQHPPVSDLQLAALARAIDALALGAFAAATALADEAHAPPPAEPGGTPAHAIVQGLALEALRRKFFRLAGAAPPDLRRA
jgi:hypothetical protein